MLLEQRKGSRTVLELFSDEGDRLGQCFGCNKADLSVLLLAHSTEIPEGTRVIENNLLSSPGSCLLPAVASSGVAPEAFVGTFGELRSDPGFCLCPILTTVDIRDIVWACGFIPL